MILMIPPLPRIFLVPAGLLAQGVWRGFAALIG
jgi:hypothetical protein